MRMSSMFLAVYLISVTGGSTEEIDLASATADLSVWGTTAGERTGSGLLVADLNGDGLPDLVFRQRGWTNAALEQVGRVCTFFGPHSTPTEHDLFLETPPLCIEGTIGEPIEISYSIEAGDLDGDGIDDLLIGSGPMVAIFRGRSTWPFTLSILDADWIFREAEFGDHLSFGLVGELNGDEFQDLVLFAGEASGPGNTRVGAGEAYIFFGPANGWTKREFDLSVDTPDVTIYGADGRADNPATSGGDFFGSNERAAVIANLLGSDTPDLIVAAFKGAGSDNLRKNAGEVYVFRGRTSWPAVIDARVVGAADLVVYGGGESGGLHDTAVADFDGDGRPDLIVAGRAYSRLGLGRDLSGGVFVFRGGATLSGTWDLATTDADFTIVGPRAGSFFGDSMELGDVNGDGYVDIIAGAGSDSTPFARLSAGSVFVIAGCEWREPLRDLALQPAELAIYGADDRDAFGRSTGVLDINADGRADILAGANGSASLNNTRGSGAGEIHLVLGRAFGTPVCTIAPNPGAPVEICGTTTDVTLDGSQSIVTNCSVTPQYRWMDGTTELRGWDVDPTFVVRPTTTTAYRLEVRCGDCAGPCFETATVLVTVDPDVTPPDLGNTVRAYRAGTDVELGWGSLTEARTYSLYRGTQKETWPPAPLSSLAATTETLPDVPGPPDLYFYRVTGASCSGSEGP